MHITKSIISKAKEYAINAHKNTNHMYDTYLPYEFHLRMVVQVAESFLHLVGEDVKKEVIAACWLHDTMEDCRTNYTDIINTLKSDEWITRDENELVAAEIVRAVTNDPRGRNRSERFSEAVQQSIREVPGALFVKLCDRIANIQYSKMSGSKMYEMYKREHDNFSRSLRMDKRYPELMEMWVYIDKLFKE